MQRELIEFQRKFTKLEQVRRDFNNIVRGGVKILHRYKLERVTHHLTRHSENVSGAEQIVKAAVAISDSAVDMDKLIAQYNMAENKR